MTDPRFTYHEEPEGWWAESADLPDLIVAGDTEGEVRELVARGMDLERGFHFSGNRCVPGHPGVLL